MRKILSEIVRILRVTKKPSKEMFMTTLRVSFLGLLLLGSLGFIIQIVGLTIMSARVPRPPPNIIIMALIAIAITLAAIIMYMRRGRRT